MIVQIENILTRAECQAMRDALADPACWTDGKATAAGAARAVKTNLQGALDSPAVKGCLEKAKSALLNSPVFCAAAQPDAFSRVVINQYATGQSYGDHVDAPYIDGKRTDVSFTLFLTDPDEYEGGELVIERPGYSDRVKGPLGSAVVYPATSLHRVDEVRSGARIAVIGWVRSRVKSAEARETLFELDQALADLRASGASSAIVTRLANVRNNLLRHFGA